VKEYTPYCVHICIDAYKDPDNIEDWEPCPYCNLKPKVWVFDNGRSTACGCAVNMSIYDHRTVKAESIMNHMKSHNGSIADYDSDELRKNWNHWVKTGEELYKG